MTSYIYYDCGCEYSITEGDWANENLCSEHSKIIDKEDNEDK